LSATVKQLLKSDSICQSYAQMKGSSFSESQCISLLHSEYSNKMELFLVM